METYRILDRDNTRVYMRDYLKEYRQNEDVKFKRNAHQQVYYAVKNGALEREPCKVCQSPATEGHHTDYSQPLVVVWLCKLHHEQEHHTPSLLDH